MREPTKYPPEEEGDGTYYSDLYMDKHGYVWNILVRAGGSVSLFATNTGYAAHGVVYDTIDVSMNDTAREVIGRLRDMAEGINLLLATVKEEPVTLEANATPEKEAKALNTEQSP
jgi:hypothetical protein